MKNDTNQINVELQNAATSIYFEYGNTAFTFKNIKLQSDILTRKQLIHKLKSNGWIVKSCRCTDGYVSWKLTTSAIDWVVKYNRQLRSNMIMDCK